MAGQQGRFSFDRFTILFILLLLLGGVTLLLFLNPLELATGSMHEKFPSMLQSGNSVAQHPLPKLLSFLFGFIIFSILITMVYIGGRKPQKYRGFRNMILVFSVVYLAIYVVTMISYWDYSSGGKELYFLGFPAPSAWMVYAVHLFPFLPIFFYNLKFHKYIMTDKEIDDFLEKGKEQTESMGEEEG